jgi:hypothetical protein
VIVRSWRRRASTPPWWRRDLPPTFCDIEVDPDTGKCAGVHKAHSGGRATYGDGSPFPLPAGQDAPLDVVIDLPNALFALTRRPGQKWPGREGGVPSVP